MPEPKDLYFFLCTQSVSCVIVVMFIFISWREGSAWWRKTAPYLYYTCLQVWGIVIPLLNVVAFVVTCLIEDEEWLDSVYTDWGLFYSLLMVARLITYGCFYRGSWVKNEFEHWEAHKQFLKDKELGKIG